MKMELDLRIIAYVLIADIAKNVKKLPVHRIQWPVVIAEKVIRVKRSVMMECSALSFRLLNY